MVKNKKGLLMPVTHQQPFQIQSPPAGGLYLIWIFCVFSPRTAHFNLQLEVALRTACQDNPLCPMLI